MCHCISQYNFNVISCCGRSSCAAIVCCNGIDRQVEVVNSITTFAIEDSGVTTIV